MVIQVSSDINFTKSPVIKGPGKVPPASTVLWLSVNTLSHNGCTENERAAEPIRSEFGVRDHKVGSGANGGGDVPRSSCNKQKE